MRRSDSVLRPLSRLILSRCECASPCICISDWCFERAITRRGRPDMVMLLNKKSVSHVVRVLFCVNEYCRREISSALLGWCREKGPHRRSIDAADASESMYTRNADRLMLFWCLCESRRASDLVWRRSVQAALLATSRLLLFEPTALLSLRSCSTITRSRMADWH